VKKTGSGPTQSQSGTSQAKTTTTQNGSGDWAERSGACLPKSDEPTRHVDIPDGGRL